MILNHFCSAECQPPTPFVLSFQCVIIFYQINIICKTKNDRFLGRFFICLNYYTNSFTSAAKVFGSNLIPGPIVVERYTDFTNVPLADDGLAFKIASANVA